MEALIGLALTTLSLGLFLYGETLVFQVLAFFVLGSAFVTVYFVVRDPAIGSEPQVEATDSTPQKPSENVDLLERTNTLTHNLEQGMDDLNDSVDRLGNNVDRLHLMLVDLKVKDHCPELFPLFPELWTPACEDPIESQLAPLESEQPKH